MAQTAQDKQASLNRELRRVLGDAYTFVRSCQFNQTFSNITYEELLDQAIGRIEGTDSRSMVRATKMERVKKIKQEIVSAVDTVKQRPPEDWMLEGDDPEDNANTAEE